MFISVKHAVQRAALFTVAPLLHAPTADARDQAAGAGLCWLADRESGRAQAIGSITGSMGFDRPQDLLEKLAGLDYTPRCTAAFPDAGRVMAKVQLGQDLDAAAVRELVGFPEALTGEVPEHFSAPDAE